MPLNGSSPIDLTNSSTLEAGAPDFAKPASRLELDGTYTTACFPEPEGRAGARGYGWVPAKDRRPVRFPALQRVMHQVPGHHSVLSLGMDINAIMAGCVARCRCERDQVVERKIVVHQPRLTRLHPSPRSVTVRSVDRRTETNPPYAPGTVSLDDAVDDDIPDLKLLHCFFS